MINLIRRLFGLRVPASVPSEKPRRSVPVDPPQLRVLREPCRGGTGYCTGDDVEKIEALHTDGNWYLTGHGSPLCSGCEAVIYP